ncbi:MAG: FkbM family methyltransferase [Xenococcaceae cyanobacterium MO_167.B52]|nr:FkbM family methyltransferase [Xenococcaceae cyanobacterium MO_167.B52]
MRSLRKVGKSSINKISQKIARFLCNSLTSKSRNRLRIFIRNFYNELENFNYKFETNGEKRVLQILKDFNIRIVFDVGANIGNWSEIALITLNNPEIHCFEIAPETYNILTKKLGDYERVILNNIGLSNQEKEVYINYVGNAGGRTSLHSLVPLRLDQKQKATEKVKSYVSTGTLYTNEKAIDKIDLLKIDTENHDFYVLQGFKELLEKDKITCIQFEYGRGSIQTKILLRDFYDFFEEYGFIVGKIYPKYVDFKSYSYATWDEDFVGPNYIAIKKTEEELIYKLQSRL